MGVSLRSNWDIEKTFSRKLRLENKMLKISPSEAVAGVFLQENSGIWLMSADVSSAVLSSCHWMSEMCQGVAGGVCIVWLYS